MVQQRKPTTVLSLQETVSAIRQRRAELERAGVVHIAIFGSVARGEDRPESDVDVLVTIAPDAPVGLLELVGISRQLEGWLGRRVDLAEPDGLKPEMKAIALKEQVVAF